MWSVFRYEEAREALADHAFFSSDPRKAARPLFGGLPQRPNLLNTDPPRHRQLRDLITRAFTPPTGLARLGWPVSFGSA